MGKLQEAIGEANRIFECNSRAGAMWVHNVISDSEMACFKAHEEENAERLTNTL